MDEPKKKIIIPKKMGRPSKKPSLELLAELYAKYNARDIADMYGVPVGTVYSWMSRGRKELSVAYNEQ